MSPRVLVVDDDPHVLKLLRVNFELDGYDVFGASSGEEALEVAAREKLDALVCDVMMPGMDGLEVVRRLRADPKTAKLAMIVVSAKAQRVDMKEGENAGADAYVTKPFDPKVLLDTVARALKKK